jgi:hypothetical protein
MMMTHGEQPNAKDVPPDEKNAILYAVRYSPLITISAIPSPSVAMWFFPGEPMPRQTFTTAPGSAMPFRGGRFGLGS